MHMEPLHDQLLTSSGNAQKSLMPGPPHGARISMLKLHSDCVAGALPQLQDKAPIHGAASACGRRLLFRQPHFCIIANLPCWCKDSIKNVCFSGERTLLHLSHEHQLCKKHAAKLLHGQAPCYAGNLPSVRPVKAWLPVVGLRTYTCVLPWVFTAWAACWACLNRADRAQYWPLTRACCASRR